MKGPRSRRPIGDRSGGPWRGRVPPLVTGLLLLLSATVLAQSGAGYDLTWNTVDGGGGTFSAAGSYSLGGTAGQPDAGLMEGGSYTLAGGFWPGGAVVAALERIYLPLVMRESP